MIRSTLFVFVLIGSVLSVDRGNFKTCDQSSFCKRQRATEAGKSPYVVVFDSFNLKPKGATFQLHNTVSDIVFQAQLFPLQDNTIRLKINEESPLVLRYESPLGDVLVQEPQTQSFTLIEKARHQISLGLSSHVVHLHLNPFRIDVVAGSEPVMSINARGLLNFEHYRRRKSSEHHKVEEGDDDNEQDADAKADEGKEDTDGEPGMWEETFKSHSDSKPHGPSSVGLDFSFPGYEFVYGLPEHADNLALRTTTNGDPYRLYNLDVFEYELDNVMALYGAVPVMLAHNEKRTLGIFWLNTAETWIDISSNTADRNMFAKLVDLVKGDEIPQVDTHWFSESGIIDVFLMLGPEPADVFRQYAALTGTTPLPPLFALAYHQSRWNYNDEQDVASVDAGFDEHDIPLDVIWLDIEHTDGKRYFTWDPHKFPNSAEMLKNISAKGRKMVTIIDPHIKRDDSYSVYKDANAHDGYFVKNKDGNTYDGWCWPGSSAWFDFSDPAVRLYWAKRFLPENYVGSTLDLYTWNDMNEPSVFNAPEVTMHKDARHYGGWEHRDVHNAYGLYVHRATVEGQLLRSNNQRRTFVLSRSFFAGSQRYGAVWTGDNTGDWSHLKASLPMLLSLNLVGITLSGADVGGFFKNPEAELLTRWYQAAAFQPFFRAHAHLDTKRREPWLMPPEHLTAIRAAIKMRYRMLPYWYTLFFNSERTGAPVMKPLWVDFPADKSTFKIQDVHLVGSAILVRPVTDTAAVGVNVYLPGGVGEVWYNTATYQKHTGGSTVYLPVDINKIPVFYRGGFIIPLRERVRRASILSAQDPYTLLVALNASNQADGDLYHDDFHSFQYKTGRFVHRRFTLADNKLTSRNLNPAGSFETDAWIERIFIVGMTSQPQEITLTAAGISSAVQLQSIYNANKKLLVIRKPAVKITTDFMIKLK